MRSSTCVSSTVTNFSLGFVSPTIEPAQRIFYGMSKKSEKRKTRWKTLSPSIKAYMLFNGQGTGEGSQIFRAAFAIHTCATKYQRTLQAFIITFFDQKMFDHVLGGRELHPTRSGRNSEGDSTYCRPHTDFTQFTYLLPFRENGCKCDCGQDAICKFKYCSGNIIGIVVHRGFSAWEQLLRRVSEEPLRVQLLHYLWYKDTTGCYEQHQREDWFSPQSARVPHTFCSPI